MVIAIIISILTVLFMAFTIVLWIVGGELFFMAPNYNKIDRYLSKNIDTLSHVSEYLLEMDYDTITIHRLPMHEDEKYNLSMNISKNGFYDDGSRKTNSETIPIPNEILNNIINLYERGVSHISCSRNFVGFTLWEFMDDIRGIEYSRSGKKPDGVQLIEIKQLSIPNWYYYIHNFEKWKTQNPHLFP